MEILLRKASSLAQAATAAASKMELDTTLRLSSHSLREDTDFTALLNHASLTLAQRIQTILDLHEAASTIRAVIGVANAKRTGTIDKSVNDLLSEQHGLDVTEKVLTGIQTSTKSARTNRRYGLDENVGLEHDPNAVKTAYKSIVARAATTSGSLPNIELPALSIPAMQQFEKQLAALKRRRMDLKDELACANLQKITLPEKVVTLLRKHDII